MPLDDEDHDDGWDGTCPGCGGWGLRGTSSGGVEPCWCATGKWFRDHRRRSKRRNEQDPPQQ